MAKASTEKDSNLNVEETSAEVPESVGNSAAVPSTSSEPAETTEHANDESSDKTATDVKAQKVSLKRKVSIMSLESEEEEDEGFIGFSNNCDDPFSCIADIKRIILNLENEITKMTLNVNPLLKVTVECGQRRNDTDTSRPSSSLSFKSDSDGMASSNEAHMLTSARAKKSTELSSPLLRVPFDQGWKRELVYRAALDSHSRKLGDIYYYTPQGKKLRSTREVSEHLAGTGLTLENFSFFKEPLGIDDPEKEIIRGAKLSRRADLTPTPSPTPIILESKRTPKPKAPKGASPEPPKAQSNKIKVKSSGARLTPQPTTPSTPTAAKRRKSMLQQSTTLAENNNTSAKKSRLQSPSGTAVHGDAARTQIPIVSPLQPCHMSCKGVKGEVPSLACSLCLCLYHPTCVGHHTTETFRCRNCRSSPTRDIPDVTVTRTNVPTTPTAPVPQPTGTPPEKRVLLRMKMGREGPGGQRQWSVAESSSPRLPSIPQGLAILNGRQFIVVPRNVTNPVKIP